MCPAEIRGRLKAFTMGQKRAQEAWDDLAWMIGVYTHTAPGKYPKRPNLVARETKEPQAMTDDDMKAVLRSFMARQNEVNHGDHA